MRVRNTHTEYMSKHKYNATINNNNIYIIPCDSQNHTHLLGTT